MPASDQIAIWNSPAIELELTVGTANPVFLPKGVVPAQKIPERSPLSRIESEAVGPRVDTTLHGIAHGWIQPTT